MDNVGRVDVLQSTQQVIHHSGDVLLFEVDGRLDHLFEVRFRQLQHKVNCVEVLGVLGLDEVKEADNEPIFE